MDKHRFWLTVLSLMGALVGAVGLPALAADYVVNTLNDNTTAGDSFCTLREAIQSANNAGNGDCGANSSADDTITFSVSGTITLSSQLPTIVSGQGALTINGGGNITVSGNNSVRVLEVASGAQLTLQNITIAQGNATFGGGTVKIKNSIVANSPSGRNCDGTVTASGVNFATDGTCTSFTVVTTAALNLGPLALNPPGTTATHALLVGSVAIDAVPLGQCTNLETPPNPVTQDQRDVARPQPSGGNCDVGAYEARFFTLTVTGSGTGNGTVTDTGISCTITAGSTSGDCTESFFGEGTPAIVTLTATPQMAGLDNLAFGGLLMAGIMGGLALGAWPLWRRRRGRLVLMAALLTVPAFILTACVGQLPTGGSSFVGWIGCDTVVGTQCTVTMNANKTITAIFNLAP